jgi:prophage tail gpP-like protein
MSNDTIREEIKQEGINFGQSFFSTNREKLRFRLSIEGSKIQPGEFAELTIQDLGINKALARISDVQHTIDGKSWTTELTMEEDDTEIN